MAFSMNPINTTTFADFPKVDMEEFHTNSEFFCFGGWSETESIITETTKWPIAPTPVDDECGANQVQNY
jgi:hypothetical protein